MKIQKKILMFFMLSTLVSDADAKIQEMPKDKSANSNTMISQIAEKHYKFEQLAKVYNELFTIKNEKNKLKVLKKCIESYKKSGLLPDNANINTKEFEKIFLDYDKAYKLAESKDKDNKFAEIDQEMSNAVKQIVNMLKFENLINSSDYKVSERISRKIKEYIKEINKIDIEIYNWFKDDSLNKNFIPTIHDGSAIVKNVDGSKAYLVFFYVNNPGNKNGLKMMSELLKVLKEKYNRVELLVAHNRLIKFYKQTGFSSNKERPEEMYIDLK